MTKYYEENKDTLLPKQKEYYANHKEQYKDYYKRNRDKILKKKREEYPAMKEIISKRNQEYYRKKKLKKDQKPSA